MEGGTEVKEGGERRMGGGGGGGSRVGVGEEPRSPDRTNSGPDLWSTQPHGEREEGDKARREGGCGWWREGKKGGCGWGGGWAREEKRRGAARVLGEKREDRSGNKLITVLPCFLPK